MTSKNRVSLSSIAPHMARWVSFSILAAAALLIVSLVTVEPVAAADPIFGIGSGVFQAQNDDQDEAWDETTAPLTGETSTTRSVSDDGREVAVPQLQPVGTSSRTVPTETAADDSDSNAEFLRIAIGAAAVVLVVVALSQRRSEPAAGQTAQRRTFSH